MHLFRALYYRFCRQSKCQMKKDESRKELLYAPRICFGTGIHTAKSTTTTLTTTRSPTPLSMFKFRIIGQNWIVQFFFLFRVTVHKTLNKHTHTPLNRHCTGDSTKINVCARYDARCDDNAMHPAKISCVIQKQIYFSEMTADYAAQRQTGTLHKHTHAPHV